MSVLHQSISACHPRQPCILILLWTAIVGVMYYIFVGFTSMLEIDRSQINTNFSVYDSLPYAILALVMMFYPLSGFIADVCCGRLKTFVISLITLLFCLIILLIAVLLVEEIQCHSNFDHPLNNNRGILVVILTFLSLFAFIIGLARYVASFIQLGLDQLFEAPSQLISGSLYSLCYLGFPVRITNSGNNCYSESFP